MLSVVRRVMAWAIAIGLVSFAIGFFGPMILAPGANQGPLLGIFITGPIGTLVGAVVGVARELAGFEATPWQLTREGRLVREHGTKLLRAGAALLGVTLVLKGVEGVRAGDGRPAAASIVVGAALLWYALVGQIPQWFRK